VSVSQRRNSVERGKFERVGRDVPRKPLRVSLVVRVRLLPSTRKRLSEMSRLLSSVVKSDAPELMALNVAILGRRTSLRGFKTTGIDSSR
jgi:hypothetical protein